MISKTSFRQIFYPTSKKLFFKLNIFIIKLKFKIILLYSYYFLVYKNIKKIRFVSYKNEMSTQYSKRVVSFIHNLPICRSIPGVF